MPLVAARGQTFHVQRLGRGAPVVMLHGLLLGSLASWYFTAAPALAEDHEVFLYDLRGHGRSTRAAAGYGLGSMVADLAALVADLRAGPLTLVGHSYGALIALRFALDQPARVARLVLVEAPVPPSGFAELDSLAAFAARTPGEMLEALPEPLRALVARGGRQARRLLEALRFLVVESTLMADLRGEPDLDDAELAGLDRPVHLVYGDRSPCLPAGRRLATALPDASLTVLPGGHYLHLDATAALTRHLVEVCGG